MSSKRKDFDFFNTIEQELTKHIYSEKLEECLDYCKIRKKGLIILNAEGGIGILAFVKEIANSIGIDRDNVMTIDCQNLNINLDRYLINEERQKVRERSIKIGTFIISFLIIIIVEIFLECLGLKNIPKYGALFQILGAFLNIIAIFLPWIVESNIKNKYCYINPEEVIIERTFKRNREIFQKNIKPFLKESRVYFLENADHLSIEYINYVEHLCRDISSKYYLIFVLHFNNEFIGNEVIYRSTEFFPKIVNLERPSAYKIVRWMLELPYDINYSDSINTLITENTNNGDFSQICEVTSDFLSFMRFRVKIDINNLSFKQRLFNLNNFLNLKSSYINSINLNEAQQILLLIYVAWTRVDEIGRLEFDSDGIKLNHFHTPSIEISKKKLIKAAKEFNNSILINDFDFLNLLNIRILKSRITNREIYYSLAINLGIISKLIKNNFNLKKLKTFIINLIEIDNEGLPNDWTVFRVK